VRSYNENLEVTTGHWPLSSSRSGDGAGSYVQIRASWQMLTSFNRF